MNPQIGCMLLADGRPEMVARAVECFKSQTYVNRNLLILDSSPEPLFSHFEAPLVEVHHIRKPQGVGVGWLRNVAAQALRDMGVDAIAHWDSDDWSHPSRLFDQACLLGDTDKLCVGYRDGLFWDTRPETGQAWIYINRDPRWMIGSSMCYQTAAWTACPFNTTERHEDECWVRVNSRICLGVFMPEGVFRKALPRMVYQIHGENTSDGYKRHDMETCSEWLRAPDYDDYCRKVMAL